MREVRGVPLPRLSLRLSGVDDVPSPLSKNVIVAPVSSGIQPTDEQSETYGRSALFFSFLPVCRIAALARLSWKLRDVFPMLPITRTPQPPLPNK